MIINRKDENREAGSQIDREGTFTCKIEKISNDGITSQGDIKIKIGFSVLIEKDEIASYAETFPVTGKASFLLNKFEDALRCPELYDSEDLIGRYVIGTFEKNKYIDKKDGTEKTNYRVSKWSYSSRNDKLPPIINRNREVADTTTELNNTIAEDEIPF